MLSFLNKTIHYLYFGVKRRFKYYYTYYIYIKWIQYKQKKTVLNIQKKDKITIVFFAMNLPMWRYQLLYEALLKNLKFNIYIVLSPCISFSKDQQHKDIETLRGYFNSKSIEYIDYEFNVKSIFDVKKELNPDLLFYPQPYLNLLRKEHDSSNFRDKLLCYYPYAFWTAINLWSYNEIYHNIAWKLYYSTELHRNDAINTAYNKGKNVVVVGYPNADIFLYSQHKDVWKSQPKRKKRIIWAPHFTIIKERSQIVHSNFLWMSDIMLEIAQKYSDLIQIAFKPHPRLLTELYVHPEWGKEKADAYYNTWKNLDNGQLDEGEFKDLFMTSDGMIHDSSSFSVEYHYSLKPVMYVQKDVKSYADTLSEFGKLAIKAHYWGENKIDIISFIEKIIIEGKDSMYPIRKNFYDTYLLPPNEKSVTENTVNDLLKSLRCNE